MKITKSLKFAIFACIPLIAYGIYSFFILGPLSVIFLPFLLLPILLVLVGSLIVGLLSQNKRVEDKPLSQTSLKNILIGVLVGGCLLLIVINFVDRIF